MENDILLGGMGKKERRPPGCGAIIGVGVECDDGADQSQSSGESEAGGASEGGGIDSLGFIWGWRRQKK